MPSMYCERYVTLILLVSQKKSNCSTNPDLHLHVGFIAIGFHVLIYTGTREPTVSNQYYYGNFRYHVRHPWARRDLSASLPDMRKVDMEDRVSVRATMARDSGFTGLSILHRLHPLCGFDVLQDTVYDAMHNVPLNVIAHHLHRYFDEGILSRQDVESRLKAFPWTPGKILLYCYTVACLDCSPLYHYT